MPVKPSSSNLNQIVFSDAGVPDEPDEYTRRWIMDEAYRATYIRGMGQDIDERKRYARRSFWLACAWIIGIFIILLLQGFKSPYFTFSLSENIILALLGGTTINVVAVYIIVVRYLFKQNDAARISK